MNKSNIELEIVKNVIDMSNLDEKEKEQIKDRSNKIIELFNSIKNLNVSSFPVPPFSKWLNGKIVSAKYGEVEVELIVRPEMANPTGLLHGGMQSAMLDDVIGMTCATLGYSGFLITIDFHVDFLGKAKVGDFVIAKGKIVHDGKTIAHAESELKHKTGELIATASSNLLKTTHKPEYVKKIDESN
jgi:acyl-coenzyme A thioesterase 13